MDTLKGAARSGTRSRLLARRPGGAVIGNVGARVVALASVAAVTILVARVGGAEDVGLLALMRVLPGLVGVVAACGLPSAMGYFVAGTDQEHQRLWPTILLVMCVGGIAGTLVWLAVTPLIHDRLMATTTVAVVLATGVTVATQLPVAVGKACLQAMGDSRGANMATAWEEAVFLPAFAVAWVAGLRGGWLLVVALLLADCAVSIWAWARIAARAKRTGAHLVGRPDRGLAVRMVRFGARSQVGGIVNLLNLRLDVVILGALAGPGPVGVYVVASKFAELLRVPGLAIAWVVYPRVAGRAVDEDVTPDRTAVRRLLALGALLGLALAASAFLVLPAAYGPEFGGAAWLCAWIAAGLVLNPAAGHASAVLMGTGRPGRNSAILGLGLCITIVLDLVLIPGHGAIGAAWASAAAYLATDLLLVTTGRAGTPAVVRPGRHRASGAVT